MANSFLALITPLGSRAGANPPDRPTPGPTPPGGGVPDRPVDPGFGVEIPVDPGYGVPILGPHPSHPIYLPDRPGVSPKPPGGEHPWFPGFIAGSKPVDPDYGVPITPKPPGGGGGAPEGTVPVWVYSPGVGVIGPVFIEKPAGPGAKPPEAQPKR